MQHVLRHKNDQKSDDNTAHKQKTACLLFVCCIVNLLLLKMWKRELDTKYMTNWRSITNGNEISKPDNKTEEIMMQNVKKKI